MQQKLELGEQVPCGPTGEYAVEVDGKDFVRLSTLHTVECLRGAPR